MAFGEAKRRPTFGRRIMQSKREERNLYNLVRRLAQPRATSIVSFAGRGADIQGQNASGFLRTSGDTMMGPIAFFPALVTISAGVIDIGELTDAFSSRVIVTPESGSTDDLVTIDNAKHNGQLLFLQGVQTDTITLKTTGNIETIDGNDFNIVDDDIIILQFDVTDNKWQQITIGKQGVAGGNEFADNLFRIFDDIDNTRKLAFQTGGISASTTRTVTIQDADGTMMLIDGTGTQIVVKPTEIQDSIFSIVDDIDGTRKLAFQVGGIAAATTRTLTVQNASGTIPLLDGSAGTQVFSNAIELNGVTLDINGNDLILDADADSRFITSVDDVLTLNLFGSAQFIWNTTRFDISAKDLQLSEIANPGAPGATSGRIFLDSADNILKIRKSSGTVSLEGVGGNEFQDSLFRIFDDIDGTRKLAFQTGGIAAATTRTWTAQDVSGTVALLDGGATQTTANVWSFTNDVTLGNTSADRLTITALIDSKVSPEADGTRELGDATHHWDDVFTETLTFRGSGGNTTTTIQAIHADAGGINYNVPTGDTHEFRVNGLQVAFFDVAGLDMSQQDVSNISIIKQSGTVADSGFIRMIDGASIGWRNGTDDANSSIRFDGNDVFQITFAGTDLWEWGADFIKTHDNAVTSFQFGTTNGHKIGTATNQKLAFYNSTPVVQQTVVSDTLANLYTALRAVGIIG